MGCGGGVLVGCGGGMMVGCGGGVILVPSPMQVTLGITGKVSGGCAANAQSSCCCGTSVKGEERRQCGSGNGR